MVFIPESEVFFVCSAIVLKSFQRRGPTKYFLQKKILFHVDLIKMLSLISLFLQFPSYFPQNSGQQKYMAYLFKLSSRLIFECDTYLLLHQMRTKQGLLKRPVLTASNTAGALQQFQIEIASLAFGRTHWARNFLCFSPLKFCPCSSGLYIKGQDWIWFFVVVIFLHFFIDSAQDTCKHT